MYEGRLQNEEKKFAQTETRLKEMPDYATEWYTYLRSSHGTAGTCYDYIYKLFNFLNHIKPGKAKDVQLTDITSLIVQKYFISIQTKKVTDKNGNSKVVATSNSYQNSVWCCLNNFFKYFVNDGKIEKNYVAQIKKASARKDLDRINEHRVLLTEDDFQKILSAVDETENFIERSRDKAVLSLLMNTGMRRTALTSIMLDDVDFENGTIGVIDKGDKVQTYCVGAHLSGVLKDWISKRKYIKGSEIDRHLFITRLGHQFSADEVMNIVKKYTKKGLGKELSPHKIRSGVASIMYSKTKDIRFVQKYIGHADISTTQRYIVSGKTERIEGSAIMDKIV